MTYFAAYDQAGRVTGYYPEDREPEGDFLTLTNEEWQAAIGLTDAHVEGGSIISKPPTPAPRRFSFLEFLDFFTEAEQLAIAGAAMTDVATKLWYDRAVGARFIALDDPRLAEGLEALVDADLISSERRDRVLQALPPAA